MTGTEEEDLIIEETGKQTIGERGMIEIVVETGGMNGEVEMMIEIIGGMIMAVGVIKMTEMSKYIFLNQGQVG